MGQVDLHIHHDYSADADLSISELIRIANNNTIGSFILVAICEDTIFLLT